MSASIDAVLLRPPVASDRSFLLELYRETRAGELAITGWPYAQQRAFVEMQFDAQDRGYHASYPQASFDVVVRAGSPVGRFYVDRTRTTIHVIDISIGLAWQRRRVGSALMHDLLREAADTGRGVTLHVDQLNPVRAWYERLGFTIRAERGVYLLMGREPL